MVASGEALWLYFADFIYNLKYFRVMLYESDVNNLLAQWKNELNQSKDVSFQDGIRDCIYDLTMLMRRNFEEEALAQEAWEQQMADDYLATIEAHDRLFA